MVIQDMKQKLKVRDRGHLREKNSPFTVIHSATSQEVRGRPRCMGLRQKGWCMRRVVHRGTRVDACEGELGGTVNLPTEMHRCSSRTICINCYSEMSRRDNPIV